MNIERNRIQNELVRRHRATVMVVAMLFVATLVLVGVAFAGKQLMGRGGDPTLVMALRISIVVFGMGAVVLRRNQFSAMRLQDIAAVAGYSGLLRTLERTTLMVALLGGTIAVMGFVITMFSGDPFDMIYVGLAASAVLFYSYPRRTAWQRVVHGIEVAGDANDPEAKGTAA